MSRRSVLLVNPPSPFLSAERVFMPLGLLQVATAIRQSGRDVEICDLSGIVNPEDFLKEKLLSSTRLREVGFTATTPQMPAVMQLLDVVRESKPDVRVILGGSHVTLVHAGVKRHGRGSRPRTLWDELVDRFDTLVAGDAILAIDEIFGADAPPLVDTDDPGSSFFPRAGDLLSLAVPDRSFLDVDTYSYSLNAQPATSIMAQLGCPYKCGFCSGRISPTFRRLRQRDAGSVVHEILDLHRRHGFSGFMFYDDELNLGRGFEPLMVALAGLRASSGVDFSYRGCVKAELVDAGQAALMAQAGFVDVLVGVESGSDSVLRNIDKVATVADNSRCVRLLQDVGIRVKALMSVGHPGESASTIEDTIQWGISVRPDNLDVSLISPLPGSPYYDDAKRISSGSWVYTARSGDRLYQTDVDFHRENSFYKGRSDGQYVCSTRTDHLSSDGLLEARRRVEDTLREELRLPYPEQRAAIHFDHSMGQVGPVGARRGQ